MKLARTAVDPSPVAKIATCQSAPAGARRLRKGVGNAERGRLDAVAAQALLPKSM